MVSLAMGAAMMGTMYFLWARCAQHGGKASGGVVVCVSLRSYRALVHLKRGIYFLEMKHEECSRLSKKVMHRSLFCAETFSSNLK